MFLWMLGVDTYLFVQTLPVHPFACSSIFCFSLDSCCVDRLTGLLRKAYLAKMMFLRGRLMLILLCEQVRMRWGGRCV